ncbi:hypothetical protein [Micromonospora globbae]|jgi:hypothetical protein|uniref:Uncharacterized protein n=1 Tax=Micromonospora globbae TaxID=1894969 RepID=A0ABZ1SD32_9ACTN|nr:hypothetical protein [Micromonospora globbae]WTF83769.1 hypothetical protein OH732_18635 [Micromonospora globbae]
MSRPRAPEPEEPREEGAGREEAASRDDAEHVERIRTGPTANPARVRVPKEGLSRRKDEGDPEASGPPPGEEA